MMISFLAVVIASGAMVLGKVDSTGPLLELFYATAGLYFGRRLKLKGRDNETTIGSDKDK